MGGDRGRSRTIVVDTEQPREQQWVLAGTEHYRNAFTILKLDRNNTLILRANTKKEDEALSLGRQYCHT